MALIETLHVYSVSFASLLVEQIQDRFFAQVMKLRSIIVLEVQDMGNTLDCCLGVCVLILPAGTEKLLLHLIRKVRSRLHSVDTH